MKAVAKAGEEKAEEKVAAARAAARAAEATVAGTVGVAKRQPCDARRTGLLGHTRDFPTARRKRERT